MQIGNSFLCTPLCCTCVQHLFTHTRRKNKAKWSLRALKNIFTSAPQLLSTSRGVFQTPIWERETLWLHVFARTCLCVSVVSRLQTDTVYLFLRCLFSVMSDSPALDISLGDLTCAAHLKVDCVIESMRAVAEHTNIACVLHVYTKTRHGLCACMVFFWLSGLFAAVQRVLQCKHIVSKNTCVTTISKGRKANVIWNIRGLLTFLSQ